MDVQANRVLHCALSWNILFRSRQIEGENLTSTVGLPEGNVIDGNVTGVATTTFTFQNDSVAHAQSKNGSLTLMPSVVLVTCQLP